VTSVARETTNGPQLVGRYVLYGAIAHGGMATVHFGRLVGPTGFTRPVAIKRLHPQFAHDPDFVQMLLDEARLAARIVHPHVVQTLDLIEGPDEVFLVMDYVRGQTLASLARKLRRRNERIPVSIAVGIMVGVLEGLHAAHEAKDDAGERLDLVHRDVSPQNVLVGTDGIARLFDFGVAKASGRAQVTREGLLKGKVSYMAPEQAEGRTLTCRTDIFAASVVLWEILAGRRLFTGDGELETLRRVLCDDVPPPGSLVELPAALDRVVMKGLEREAEKRYATAREMARDLDVCLAPATPAQIGSWVERTAAEELEERASRIAAIERSAAESGSRVTRVASIPGPAAQDAPVPSRPRVPSAVWLSLAVGGAALAVAAVVLVTVCIAH
jgi:serine/threonine-protein kinase